MEIIKNISDVRNHFYKQLSIKRNMIRKAIDASYNMLDLNDFVNAAGFELPDVMELNCIRQFKADIPVLITRKLIESFGYKGEFKKQKENLIKLIEAHNLPYIKMTNEEYKKFVSPICGAEKKDEDSDFPSDIYPLFSTKDYKLIHILMMPSDLNKLMMVVNTPKGDIMRTFCQTLSELFDLYVNYQSEYKSKQLSIKDAKIDELLKSSKEQTALMKDIRTEQEEQTNMLDSMVDKLDKATDERAPRTRSIVKHGRFMLVKLNKKGHSWEYYVIRAQRTNATQSYKNIAEKFPGNEIILDIEYQPNAINLFNLIKEELRKNRAVIKVTGNYIKLAAEYTHEMFLTDIDLINEDRKDVR
jgi:hypothetical protein